MNCFIDVIVNVLFVCIIWKLSPYLCETASSKHFHFVCRNRRSREEAILRAIEEGAKTLYDIVANVYSGVDRSLWVLASWNVRVHVEHLAQLDKLPKVCSDFFLN